MLFPIDQNVNDFEVEATSRSAINLSWNGRFRGAEKIVVESSSPGQFQLSQDRAIWHSMKIPMSPITLDEATRHITFELPE